jgi:ribulose-5-phosphate 4-epimerase/fuculose-1-phosphate aldolase
MTIFPNECQQVVDAAQKLTHAGHLSGTGGNISTRIQGQALFTITPSNYDYLKMIPEDISILTLDLEAIAGQRKPSVESAMHAAIYRTRPDVNAIIHTHQVHPSTLAIINTPIPTLFDEQVLFLGNSVEVIPYRSSGSKQLATVVADATRSGHNAFILANHGALVLGQDLERALHNVAVLEKCAKVYLLALCSGKEISTLSDEAGKTAYENLKRDLKDPGVVE